MVRTIFNGWTTARRFQLHSHCKLGCSGWHHEDSLEHYARCPAIHALRTKRLNLRINPWNKSIFLALHLPTEHNNDPTLTKVALLIYTAYRTYNTIKLDPAPANDLDTLMHLMDQYLVEGVAGHPKATRILDTAYLRTRPTSRTSTAPTSPIGPHLGDLDDIAIFDLH